MATWEARYRADRSSGSFSARALYRRPKILFLDEATAHLDCEKEREISQRLEGLNITRISIAHRSELVEGADVMLRVTSRTIAPISSPEARSRRRVFQRGPFLLYSKEKGRRLQYARPQAADTAMSSAGIRFLGATVLVLELTGCGGGIPSINPSNAPTQTTFGVLGNGGVSAIVPHGGVTYIGGNFDELAAITGAFARLDAVTAKRIAPLAETQGGEVRTSVSDGNGGFYIGGTFILVGGNTRSKIAHILANGSVDADFNPALPLQDAVVNALAISGDGSTLYVGGGFDFIGGQTRHNLAAVNAVNGTVTNFNPAGLGTDGQVFALEVSGTQVYVGGQFAHLGGQMRNGLAKVAGSTGGDLGWIPNPTLGAGGGVIFSIKVSGDSVYAGGVFTSIGGQQRTNLAKLSATTGAADAGFAPNPNDVVMALALSGTTIYVGGAFNNISGQSRPLLARLDAVTGALNPFNAQLVPTDGVRALAITGGDLYVGGFLTKLAASRAVRSQKSTARVARCALSMPVSATSIRWLP